jgi:hypothetical protein
MDAIRNRIDSVVQRLVALREHLSGHDTADATRHAELVRKVDALTEGVVVDVGELREQLEDLHATVLRVEQSVQPGNWTPPDLTLSLNQDQVVDDATLQELVAHRDRLGLRDR